MPNSLDPLDQLRAANPVPDAALSDVTGAAGAADEPPSRAGSWPAHAESAQAAARTGTKLALVIPTSVPEAPAAATPGC